MSLRAEVAGPVDLLEVHRRYPAEFPFLLQSVAGHPQSGRYDMLFGYPQSRITGPEGFRELSAAFAAAAHPPRSELPFAGGWFLLLGYEAAGLIERRLSQPASPYRLPNFLAVRCPAAMIHDRERGVTTVVSEFDQNLINHMKNILHEIDLYQYNISTKNHVPLVDEVREDPSEKFIEGVRRILDYLRAGDAFQINLSRGWRAALKPGVDPVDVYRSLRQANPAPFAGLVQVDGVAVLSSSPERLVQIEGRQVQTRPIAGTRPRGAGSEDAVLRDQLIGNLKERAEHVMLIDLERNDLGRVCEPGSVEVSELMTLESYAHVHHIVSNVRGRLREGVGPGEVLEAVFPGGTITGCPKVRAMQIIAELEEVGRGPYTGAMGYLSLCGRLDTNILIRSLVIQDGVVNLRAGAGIVADSDPEAELAETRAKARGLLLALGAVS